MGRSRAAGRRALPSALSCQVPPSSALCRCLHQHDSRLRRGVVRPAHRKRPSPLPFPPSPADELWQCFLCLFHFSCLCASLNPRLPCPVRPSPRPPFFRRRALTVRLRSLVPALTEPKPALPCSPACPCLPADELWRCASSAFVAVVQSGLPSLNIAAHTALTASSSTTSATSAAPSSSAAATTTAGAVMPPEGLWSMLVRAFEMSLLGKSLPPGLQQQLLTGSGGGAAATSPSGPPPALPPLRTTMSHRPSLDRATHTESAAASAVAATSTTVAAPTDAEVQASILDCLSDTVLTSCQYAPVEARQALVGVLDMGAAAPTPDEAELPAASRFSHACLSKLYVLCSRGWDPRGVSAAQHSGEQQQLVGSGGSSGAATPLASASGADALGGAGGSGANGAAAAGGLRAGQAGSLSGRLSGGEGAGGAAGGPKDQNARCLIEVAQLALPVFLARCGSAVWAWLARSRLRLAAVKRAAAHVKQQGSAARRCRRFAPAAAVPQQSHRGRA